MWIDPIPRGAQRESAFDQSRNEQRAEAQPAHVSGFEHTQAVPITEPRTENLSVETAINFVKKDFQRDPVVLVTLSAGWHDVSGNLNTADRCCKRSPQTLQPPPIESDLRQLGVSCTPTGPG